MTNDLLAIVLAFAAEEPLWDADMGTTHCTYCDGIDNRNGRVEHDDDCPWLAAKRVAEAQA